MGVGDGGDTETEIDIQRQGTAIGRHETKRQSNRDRRMQSQ